MIPEAKKMEAQMKKILVLATAAMMVFVLAGGAFAVNEVSVSATVNAKCGTVTAGNIADFAIDPDSAVDITRKTSDAGGTQPTVKCTKGTTVTVTCTADNGGKLIDPLDTPAGDIPFTVSCPPSYLNAGGFGAPDSIDVSVTVAAGVAAAASATQHTGSVTVEVAN